MKKEWSAKDNGRKRLGEMLGAIAAMEKTYGLRCINVFHAGDGNLHPLILYDANVAGELERTEAFGAEILKLSVDLGGTLTGEHGVGIEKLPHMRDMYAPADLALMHKIRAAFTPDDAMNPYKVLPREGVTIDLLHPLLAQRHNPD